MFLAHLDDDDDVMDRMLDLGIGGIVQRGDCSMLNAPASASHHLPPSLPALRSPKELRF